MNGIKQRNIALREPPLPPIAMHPAGYTRIMRSDAIAIVRSRGAFCTDCGGKLKPSTHGLSLLHADAMQGRTCLGAIQQARLDASLARYNHEQAMEERWVGVAKAVVGIYRAAELFQKSVPEYITGMAD